MYMYGIYIYVVVVLVLVLVVVLVVGSAYTAHSNVPVPTNRRRGSDVPTFQRAHNERRTKYIGDGCAGCDIRHLRWNICP